VDPRQHVSPGDPISLAAEQINGLNRLLATPAGFRGPGTGEPAVPYTWVLCRSSVTVARWGVLAITGLEITPATAAGVSAFESMPIVTGATPSATTTAWGIAVEPIAAGKVGRLAVAGVVQCKVEVTHADDKFATCKESASELKAGPTGEGIILWKESGTGSGKWSLVRLADGPQGLRRGTFPAPWTKGSTRTVTDALTSTTYTARNYFAAITGTGTKACAIAYVGTEWILIAAECS
jgi:hypothetical protein